MKQATWIKTLKILAGGLLSCGLLACQMRETVIVRESGGNNKPSGTVDGGGQNGVGGKRLEDWVVELPEQAEYKDIVKPLIENLRPCYLPLAADLVYLSTNVRKWYFVPVELSEIPAVRLGTPFAKSQQFAIQNYQDIWVDSRYYEKMPPGERAGLIVHELVVGVKLLKDHYPEERCLAAVTLQALMGKKKDSELEEARNKCREMYPRILAPPKIDFGADTASEIRSLTIDLIKSNGGQDRSRLRCGELKSRLKSAGLRDYDMI